MRTMYCAPSTEKIHHNICVVPQTARMLFENLSLSNMRKIDYTETGENKSLMLNICFSTTGYTKMFSRIFFSSIFLLQGRGNRLQWLNFWSIKLFQNFKPEFAQRQKQYLHKITLGEKIEVCRNIVSITYWSPRMQNVQNL